jgi:hypothetical protein
MTNNSKVKTPPRMPEWYRLKHRNLFEWSCQETYSKNSKGSKAWEKATQKTTSSKKLREKASRQNTIPKELVPKGTYLENIRTQDRVHPLIPKETALRVMTSVVTLGFIELSRHLLPIRLTLTRLDTLGRSGRASRPLTVFDHTSRAWVKKGFPVSSIIARSGGRGSRSADTWTARSVLPFPLRGERLG